MIQYHQGDSDGCLMKFLLCSLLVALAVAAPSVAAAEEDRPMHIRLTFRYTDVTDETPGPDYERFMYLEMGLTFTNEYLWVDFNTPMGVVIIDGIGAVISFLGGGSGDLPIMAGLNPSDQEPGWITIFEISGGPQVFHFGDVHLGFGPLFQWSWQFPYFDGERVNIQPLDFGVATNLWWNADFMETNLQLGLGNGWHAYGDWNPFVQIVPSFDIPIWEWLSLHLSGRLQFRRISYADYEETLQVDVPTETVQGVTYHLMWAAEIGPSISF